MKNSRNRTTPETAHASSPGACALLIAATMGLAAAWVAAGSVGLMGHPLRRGLVWVLLILTLMAVRPARTKRWRLLPLLAAVALTAGMLASSLRPVNVLAVAVLLCTVAWFRPPEERLPLVVAAESALVLAIYRLLVSSVPLIWQASDCGGWALGWVVAKLTGGQLHIGATFGGLDYLVVMTYLVVRLSIMSPDTTRSKVVRAALRIALLVACHLAYLMLLRYTTDILAALPTEAAATPDALSPSSTGPGSAFAHLMRELLPWNLLIFAAVLHCLLAYLFLWQARRLDAGREASGRPSQPWTAGRTRYFLIAVALMSAAAFPVATTVCWQGLELEGKRIVVHEKGFLNWLKPEHGDYGRLGSGMYGMLPAYLESFGAECLISPDLKAADLDMADALVLIYPDEPWSEGQLERIWRFVRSGGSLLVLAEHTVREDDGANRINEVLAPTSITVEFDSSMFAVGGWLHSYDALAHPTTAGISDEENAFGLVIGATLQAGWNARPLIAGRWGWSDVGDETNSSAMMGNREYDPGEKLGDLILAAEQPYGLGKIIVFGDTSGFTNGLTVGCHAYTSRLYAYLASSVSTCQAFWRQLLGLCLAVLLIILVLQRPTAGQILATALVVGVSLSVCNLISGARAEVLPDGRFKSPNNLAYVDASHLHAYSRESWRPEGVMGLCLTLMRNGYLTLMLPELTDQRLERARVLVSVAPLRPYSELERRSIESFVEDGGILICTAGCDEGKAVEPLLRNLGYHLGGDPGIWRENPGEPTPLGHFKTAFFNGGDYRAYVRFHAAWRIDCDDPNALVVSYHPPDKPLIMIRRYGKGLVALIGDTCFAMNKNLERESGEPFEGMRENADFWRWFLALLGEGDMWYPPRPEQPDAAPQPERDSTTEEES